MVNDCFFCFKPTNNIICNSCLKRENKRVKEQNKRSKKYNCGILSINDWIESLIQNNFKCKQCKARKHFLTLDHIVSMAKGGLNKKENIQPLCSSCHEIKGTIETKKQGNKKRREEAKEIISLYKDLCHLQS